VDLLRFGPRRHLSPCVWRRPCSAPGWFATDLAGPALKPIAEIVHDIDLKD